VTIVLNNYSSMAKRSFCHCAVTATAKIFQMHCHCHCHCEKFPKSLSLSLSLQIEFHSHCHCHCHRFSKQKSLSLSLFCSDITVSTACITVTALSSLIYYSQVLLKLILCHNFALSYCPFSKIILAPFHRKMNFKM